jgi:hypothetical protein
MLHVSSQVSTMSCLHDGARLRHHGYVWARRALSLFFQWWAVIVAWRYWVHPSGFSYWIHQVSLTISLTYVLQLHYRCPCPGIVDIWPWTNFHCRLECTFTWDVDVMPLMWCCTCCCCQLSIAWCTLSAIGNPKLLALKAAKAAFTATASAAKDLRDLQVAAWHQKLSVSKNTYSKTVKGAVLQQLESQLAGVYILSLSCDHTVYTYRAVRCAV